MTPPSLDSALLHALKEGDASTVTVFRNPNLRRIQFAFAGSIIGDRGCAAAGAVYVYDEQGGPTLCSEPFVG